MDQELIALSEALAELARQARGETPLRIVTAESCTGGWVAQVITHTAGSSAWFDRGFVTYSNASKEAMLGVRTSTLAAYGAVSLDTAAEMAAGALRHSDANWALSITGIAGPGGGSVTKPVGTVCFAWCRRGGVPACEQRRFEGDREAIRKQAVIHALAGLIERARNMP